MYKKLFAILFTVLVIVSIATVTAVAADGRVDVIVSIPTASVAANGTFSVDVKFKDASDLTEAAVAGLQIELAFDKTKFAASTSNITVDSALASQSGAFHGYNVTDGGKVIFLAIKDGFTTASGFSGLTNIFSIKFTALAAVSNPYNAITISNATVDIVVGNGNATAISASIAKEGSSPVPSLSFEKVTPAELTYKSDAKIGGADVGAIVTGIKDLTTFADLEALYAGATIKVRKSDGTYIASTAKVGTGMIIELYEGVTKIDEATAIILGDTTGDGQVKAGDLVKLRRFTKDSVTYALDACFQFAVELTGDGNLKAGDIVKLTRYMKDPVTYPIS